MSGMPKFYFTSPQGHPLAAFAVAVEAEDEIGAFQQVDGLVPSFSDGGLFYKNPDHRALDGKNRINLETAIRIASRD